jgi:hypothetical protein
MSPDGAEAVLKHGRYVRSSPVDKRLHKGHAYWESHDFDGNGHIGFMRQACSDGELVELPDFPGVMVPRLPEDPPPYYKLYPEGRIANFDGRRIPIRTFSPTTNTTSTAISPTAGRRNTSRRARAIFPAARRRRERCSTSPSRTRTSSRG